MTKIGYFQQILNSQMGYPLDWPWPLAPCTATALDTHSNIHGLLHILPSTYFEFLCTHSPFIPTTNFRWITHKHLYNVTYYLHNTSTIQKNDCQHCACKNCVQRQCIPSFPLSSRAEMFQSPHGLPQGAHHQDQAHNCTRLLLKCHLTMLAWFLLFFV